MEDNSHFDSFESQLNMDAKGFLSTAAGWAMFLSIIGFLMCALSLLGSLGMIVGAAAMGDSNPAFAMMPGMGIVFLISTIVLFIPVLFLFKFSVTMKRAIESSDIEKLTLGFRNLKNYFVWAGILTIIWILSYVYLMVSVLSNAAELGGM
jgi:hypothetical protein